MSAQVDKNASTRVSRHQSNQHADVRAPQTAKTRVFAAIVILSNVLGNYALARGMRGQTTATALDYILVIFTPWVACGISLLILWLLSRMALLSWADLTYVLPVTSLGYVLSALVGHFLLDETITPSRWAGTLLIVAGTVLVGMGSPHSQGKGDL